VCEQAAVSDLLFWSEILPIALAIFGRVHAPNPKIRWVWSGDVRSVS
jgi:hypothetical protein